MLFLVRIFILYELLNKFKILSKEKTCFYFYIVNLLHMFTISTYLLILKLENTWIYFILLKIHDKFLQNNKLDLFFFLLQEWNIINRIELKTQFIL